MANKFASASLEHSGFIAIKEKLTAELAQAIERELIALGDDAKGISWFSSSAYDFAVQSTPLAA